MRRLAGNTAVTQGSKVICPAGLVYYPHADLTALHSCPPRPPQKGFQSTISRWLYLGLGQAQERK